MARIDSLESPVLAFRYLPVLAAVLVSATPACASGGTPLPEPSSLFLLGIGVAGVVVGRRFSRKRRPD